MEKNFSQESRHKRQKQYFEQRKRQQQQQTTGLDSFSDGMNTCNQHQNNIDHWTFLVCGTYQQLFKIASQAAAVDAMIRDINWPLCGNFFELPFCSRGTENSFSKPRQKLSTAKEFSQFKSNASKLKNSFSDDEIFCNMEEKNDDIWNARSNFLDRNFLDEDWNLTWKNRSPKMDGSSADFLHLGNHEI